MILRGRPKDIEQYIIVNNEDSNKLHKAGYRPQYIDGITLYYKKTKELEENYQRIIGGEAIE